jgi:hypothetical protein
VIIVVPSFLSLTRVIGIVYDRDPKKRPHTREQIIALAQEIWEKLPWERIYKWIDSMPKRLEKLRRNRGGPTKY